MHFCVVINWLAINTLHVKLLITVTGIHRVLLQKEKCPKCASTKYKIEDLLPNLSLRQNVACFLESQILMGNSDNAYRHDAPGRKNIFTCSFYNRFYHIIIYKSSCNR